MEPLPTRRGKIFPDVPATVCLDERAFFEACEHRRDACETVEELFALSKLIAKNKEYADAKHVLQPTIRAKIATFVADDNERIKRIQRVLQEYARKKLTSNPFDAQFKSYCATLFSIHLIAYTESVKASLRDVDDPNAHAAKHILRDYNAIIARLASVDQYKNEMAPETYAEVKETAQQLKKAHADMLKSFLHKFERFCELYTEEKATHDLSRAAFTYDDEPNNYNRRYVGIAYDVWESIPIGSKEDKTPKLHAEQVQFQSLIDAVSRTSRHAEYVSERLASIARDDAQNKDAIASLEYDAQHAHTFDMTDGAILRKVYPHLTDGDRAGLPVPDVFINYWGTGTGKTISALLFVGSRDIHEFFFILHSSMMIEEFIRTFKIMTSYIPDTDAKCKWVEDHDMSIPTARKLVLQKPKPSVAFSVLCTDASLMAQKLKWAAQDANKAWVTATLKSPPGDGRWAQALADLGIVAPEAGRNNTTKPANIETLDWTALGYGEALKRVGDTAPAKKKNAEVARLLVAEFLRVLQAMKDGAKGPKWFAYKTVYFSVLGAMFDANDVATKSKAFLKKAQSVPHNKVGLVIDEVHNMRNVETTSKRAQNVLELFTGNGIRFSRVLGLTATLPGNDVHQSCGVLDFGCRAVSRDGAKQMRNLFVEEAKSQTVEIRLDDILADANKAFDETREAPAETRRETLRTRR